MKNAIVILDRSLTSARLAAELLKPAAGEIVRTKNLNETVDALDRLDREGCENRLVLLNPSAVEGDLVAAIDGLRHGRPNLAVLVAMDAFDARLAAELLESCGPLADWILKDTRFINALPIRARRLMDRTRAISERLDGLAGILMVSERPESAPGQAAAEIADLRRRLSAAAEALKDIRSGRADLDAGLPFGSILQSQGNPSDRLYRRLLESLPDGIVICSKDGEIRFGNNRAAELLGLARRALEGALLPDCVGPADRDAVSAALEEALAGDPSEAMINLRDDLGEPVSVAMTMSELVSGPDDDPENVLALVCLHHRQPTADAGDTISNLDRDVRRMHLLNRVVRRAQRITDLDDMLQRILSAIMNALSWDGGAFFLAEGGMENGGFRATRGQVPAMDDPQVVAAFRSAAAKVLEAAPASAPQPVVSKYHDEPSSILTVLIDSAMAKSGRIPGFKTCVLIALSSRDQAQGALCLFSRKPRELSGEENDIIHAVCPQVAVAIENARLLKTVSQARADWENTFDAIPDPAFIIDDRHVILNANMAFCKSVGMTRDQVSRRKCHEIIHGSSAPYLDCPALETMRTGKTEAREIEDREKGRTWWVTCSPLPPDASGMRRFVHVSRDISDIKRLHRELAHAERMSSIGRLVSGIAHELNNPLTGILGYSQILAGDDSGGVVRKEMKQIAFLAERCRMIVQNLISFAREKPPSVAPVDVARVLNDAVNVIEPQIQAGGIEVRREIEHGLPVVMAEEYALRHAFLNVIENALQAMEGMRGTLTVRAFARDESVILEFQDTGTGIEESDISRVFEPFFTTREVGKGTGLGLSVVYGTISELGGTVTAENASRGGALIRVRLPAQPGAISPAPSAQPPANLDGKKILVIDDEEPILELARCLLEAEGCVVTCVNESARATDVIAGTVFDAVISDIKMPGVSGAKLYEMLQEKHPEALSRLIFMTGDTATPDARRFAGEAGIPVIEKPFDIDDFVEVVRKRATAG
ncbi:MAG TPA: PAS domain S-box protein [Candidatus Brocadiia bacterium]|nr:PAS domain S-box protein [Candidatus Brocadiia bacterium]